MCGRRLRQRERGTIGLCNVKNVVEIRWPHSHKGAILKHAACYGSFSMLILSVLILWLAWCFNWSAFLCESNCGVIGGRCFVIARYLYSYSVVHTIPELCWCVAGMCSRGGWGCATGASRGTTCSSTPGPGTTVRQNSHQNDPTR